MMKGVYKITNEKTGRVYIGSSGRLRYRLGQHKSNLRYNRHTNKHLQNSWNKHGENAFTFTVIEECDDYETREQYWLNHYNEIGDTYNILDVCYSPKGYKHTEEAKRLIAESSKIMWEERRDELVETMTKVNRDPERNNRRSRTATKQRSGKYQGMVLEKNGVQLVVRGSLKRFAEKNGLHYSTLWNVLNKKLSHVNNWRLK